MSGWKPIESVPKDGTKVLVYDPKGGWDDDADEFRPAIEVASYKLLASGYVAWEGYYSGTDPVQQPTHWMPLPKAPEPDTQAPAPPSQVQRRGP